MSFSGGGATRTMGKDIVSAIDAEIACLKQAKALLSTSGEVVAKRKEECCKGRLIGFSADTIDSATDTTFCCSAIPRGNQLHPRQIRVGVSINQQLPGGRSDSQCSAEIRKTCAMATFQE